MVEGGMPLSAGDALDQVYHSDEGVVEGGPVVEIFRAAEALGP
jgi:hypothetical protein